MVKMETIVKAYQKLREEGIQGVLVGSAALMLHGYSTDPPDIDFLCERKPADAKAVDDYAGGFAYEIDGVRVDYIAEDRFDAVRAQYFHPEYAVTVAGVPVAPLSDVVGLKAWRDRPKDHETLRRLGLEDDTGRLLFP